MVHGSLTRSDWYSLFLANRKWEKGIHCPPAGKGIMVSTALWQGKGMPSRNWQRVWLFRYCCSTSTISQSSATFGSLATGTEGVVGLAAGGVDGGVKFGNPGTLVSPGKGNSRRTGNERTGTRLLTKCYKIHTLWLFLAQFMH